MELGAAKRGGGVRTPRWFVAALVAVVVAGPASVGADHAWNDYHWARTSNPLALKLGDNVGGGWDVHLRRAAARWATSGVVDTKVVAGRTGGQRCRPTPGRVEVCGAAYGATGWLGIADIWSNGAHITQATVRLNNTYFAKAAYNTPAWRRHVMCHEIGHTVGLDHVNEDDFNPNTGSCMDYTDDPDGTKANPDQASNVGPNQHDFDQLAVIYGHADGSASVRSARRAAAPDAAAPPTPAGPEEGGVSVVTHDLGGGDRVVTFVLWADADLIAGARANPGAPPAALPLPTDR